MFVKSNDSKNIFSGIMIGLLLGLIFGVLIGNPFLGIILGGFLGFKIPYEIRKRSHKGNIHISGRIKKGNLILLASVGIILLLFLYFFRPWIHDLIILFYTVPSISFLFLSAGLMVISMRFKKKALYIPLFVLMGIIFFALVFNDVLTQLYIVKNIEYNRIDDLPDSENLRLLPKAIALRYLEDSLQKSRERVGPLDIIKMNDSLVWTSPRVPDGNLIYLTEKMNGLLIADATKTGRDTRMITQPMEIGEGIGITDNIFWRLYKKKFFINIDDIYYLESKGEIYAVASAIGYKFRFPVMVPYFKGVFTVDKNGAIEWIDVNDIGKNEIFMDNKIYPESLARYYVDSYKYNLGWMNVVFFHKDQIEISDVYGQSNKQPFLMDTADGLKWIIATEPYGRSYGVFKIFLVDAFDGKIDFLELNEDQTLTGPVRVVSYVKKKFPTIDWATSKVVEPRPYIIQGKIYWMLSITPSDFAGVSYTVLVDSETNEVLAFNDDSELEDYIRSGVIDSDFQPDEGDELDSDTAKEDSDVPVRDSITEIDDTTKKSIKKKISDIEKELDELKELLD